MHTDVQPAFSAEATITGRLSSVGNSVILDVERTRQFRPMVVPKGTVEFSVLDTATVELRLAAYMASTGSNDAWLDALPDSMYGLCPCGCNRKLKYAIADGIEKHEAEFRRKYDVAKRIIPTA